MKLKLAAATLAALLPVACGDGDSPRPFDEVRTNRSPLIPRGSRFNDAQRLGLEPRPGEEAANPHAGNPHGGVPEFAWDLPEGWKELPPQNMREVNLTLARDPSVECYLTVMPGGGGLEMNVNRWREQMRLPPLSAPEIAELPTAKFFGRDAPFVELTGTYVGRGAEAKQDYGFLAIFLEAPRTAVTLKMTGPAAVIAQEKDRFLALAASLRLESRATPAAGTGPAPAAGNDAIAAGMASGASGFAWDVPEGWTLGKERMMRMVTLHPEGSQEAQCYVAMIAGNAGGVDMNVNRWLGEIGKEPLQPDEVGALPTLDMLGTKAVIIESYGDEHRGMDGKSVEGAGLLGVVCLLEGRALFVKLVGPAELVKRQKDNFLAFSRSLRTEE